MDGESWRREIIRMVIVGAVALVLAASAAGFALAFLVIATGVSE